MEDKNEFKPSWKSKLKQPLRYFGIAIMAGVVSVGLFAGVQYAYQLRQAKITTDSQGLLDNPASAQLGPEGGLLKKTSESFRMVAKKVGPAVVNIKSTKGAKQQKPRSVMRRRGQPMPSPDEDGGGMGPRDPFYEFFERFGSPFPFPQQESPQTSLGSGVIIDSKKGYVITNNHVVEDASEILVTLASEKTDLKAKIVGTDPKTDLAVLKIENPANLPAAAELADSDSVEVGDWAIAIGSPFALGQSVTVGIVSAKGGRNAMALAGAEYGGDLLQTDAAINPGNSGGPLCDLDGRVMGINTAIYTRSGGYMGIGFAIPSNLVKDVTGKLITDGKIVRGWLGVYIQPLDAELAKELGLKDGVGIHEVIEESPAAKAGLRAGDVVVEVEGKPVKEVNQLQRTIGSFKPGQSVKIKVVSYSDKKSKTVTVKIGELPAEEAQDKGGKGSKKQEEPDKLGIIVGPAANKQGVEIKFVQPGSVAEQFGLEVEDVLLRVNGKAVDSVSTYQKYLSSAKRRIYLEVKRKGRTLFYQFPLPE